MPPSESRRLDILSAREITDLYGLPSFTDEERRLYFDLSESERAAVDALLPATALHFVLYIGYFKAKRQFFVYDIDAVRDDAMHVLNRYFAIRSITSISTLSKTRRFDIQQAILTLFSYRRCDSSAKATLENRARRTAMLSTQPITILRDALQYLEAHRCAGLYVHAGCRKSRGDRRAAPHNRAASKCNDAGHRAA